MSTAIGDITIEKIHHKTLSDEDIEALNVFENVMQAESHPGDPPIPVELSGARERNIPDFIVANEFWAREPDGSLAAIGYVYWYDVPENRHAAWPRIEVRPDRRRRGIAREYLRLLLPIVEADERTLLFAYTHDDVDSGSAFARRLGAEVGLRTHTNRLLLAHVDPALVERWIADGPSRAPGYSLLMIDGPYPEEMIEAVAELQDVMNTAPLDDLDQEDRKHTPEIVRQWEDALAAEGTERWVLVARHDETGELAGYTEVMWNPGRPETISQGDTGVLPKHRGHALGKWLKAAMLARILDERPAAMDIRTGNADSNDAMLGINHALGFAPYKAACHWQVGVDKVRDYLSGSRS